MVSLDVQFLPDVNIPCPDCRGSRYARAAYEVKLTNKAGRKRFSAGADGHGRELRALNSARTERRVSQKLAVLKQLGLGYLTLGEETPSLSGGEAQRLKLASEIGKTQTDSVFVFDEPSIGLHPLDVRVLLGVFQTLLDQRRDRYRHRARSGRDPQRRLCHRHGPRRRGRRRPDRGLGTPWEIRDNQNSVTGRYL